MQLLTLILSTTLATADSSAAAPPASPPAGAPLVQAASAGTAPAGRADEPGGESRRVRAVPVQGPITIDGVPSEPVWGTDNVFDGFTEREPVEGSVPSMRTEVRVAYDDAAIYVAAWLYDPSPDSIVARLARRDASISADRFAVYLDPYHDRRSGYYFMVNAAGTQYDGTLSNDVDDDKLWDGVWEGKARVTAEGWTVEMRIPYSQLRFQSGDARVWGINFAREIPRRREKDFAAFRPHKASGFVSRFPELTGIDHLRTAHSIELMPYVTSQAEYLAHKPRDPFNNGSRLRGNTGGDLRVGIGSRLTLNGTVNPDFGQVEVDPAKVNLTDVESFFDEKRPFFVEGASTFQFGRQGAGDYWDYDWSDPLFFYSRRIGRQPQGQVPDADYADVPVAARILGAAKLTGMITPAWSLGTLHAITNRETARLSSDGLSSQAEIEPLTYYGVARGQREFGDRRVGLGLLGTAAVRSFDDPKLRDQLNGASLMGGFDGWMFLDRSRTWVLSGWSALSRVQGDPARMIAVQRSSTHYFQRPDAGEVGVDSSATSLTGYGSRYWLNKQKGATQFNASVGFLSPKLDLNDLGYQDRSDVVNAHVGTGYKWTRPTRLWRYQSLKAAAFSTYDYAGNVTKRGVQATYYGEFHGGGDWSLAGSFNPRSYNNRRTRGGPLTLNLPGYSLSTYLETDAQRRLFYFADLSGSSSRSGSWLEDFYPGVEWKPAATFNLKLSPGWEYLHDDAQFVTSHADPTAVATYGRRYVFAALDQKTASASVRLNWTFTTKLSLETYVQPFVSSAHYRDMKALVAPRSYTFVPATYGDNLDFTVRSLKGNAVLRWEYLPGSALFFVWTQKRSEYEPVDAFSVSTELVKPHPQNIFLVKASYYFTP